MRFCVPSCLLIGTLLAGGPSGIAAEPVVWRPSADARITVSPRLLVVTSLGRDPWIATQDLPADARGPFELRLRAAGNAAGNGAVYYAGEPGQDFSGARVVMYPFEHDGRPHDVTVRIPVERLLRMRLDPATQPGDVEITALALFDVDGREVKRWVGPSP